MAIGFLDCLIDWYKLWLEYRSWGFFCGLNLDLGGLQIIRWLEIKITIENKIIQNI